MFFSEGKLYRTRARGNFRKKKQTPLVGDFVEFKADNEHEGYILKILARKNQLIRPPVANIDTAIVVTACVEPDFSSNLLDRQLVMLAKAAITPVLYFSKADLLDETSLKQMTAIAEYYRQYYRVLLSNEERAQHHLAQALLGDAKEEVVVVMGQTGAGKSTLLNQFDSSLKLATGQISKALSRGKHTTRKVTLMPIEGNLLADTPGFSSFDLRDIPKEELPQLFDDFLEYAPQCRFRGCLHLNEPNCAVKEAVQAGEILASRYDNYKLFQAMIASQKPQYKNKK